MLSFSLSISSQSWILEGESRPCALGDLSHSPVHFYFCLSITSLGDCPFISSMWFVYSSQDQAGRMLGHGQWECYIPQPQRLAQGWNRTQLRTIRANTRVLPKVPEKVLLSLSEMAGAEDQGSQRLLGAPFVSSLEGASWGWGSKQGREEGVEKREGDEGWGWGERWGEEEMLKPIYSTPTFLF